jgi:hypothetical protein
MAGLICYLPAMADAVAAEVTIWTDGPRAGAVGDAIDLMGAAVRPIAVGGPRVAEVDALARRLDCRRDDDLRKMVIEQPAAFVVLATMDEATCADLAHAVEQSSTILAIEPPATTADDMALLASNGSGGPVSNLFSAPAFVATPGWTRAADPRETLGTPRTLAFDTCGRLDEISLLSRLFDAWQTLLHFTPLPQSIDATLVGPMGELPRDLRGLTGSITAHARIADGMSAVLHATDRAAVSRRRLHVLSDAAELLVRDTDYELHDTAGTLIDEHRPKLTRTGLADLIAAQWQRLLERRSDVAAWPDALDADALACCHACLLSARTGAPEDPGKLLRLPR